MQRFKKIMLFFVIFLCIVAGISYYFFYQDFTKQSLRDTFNRPIQIQKPKNDTQDDALQDNILTNDVPPMDDAPVNSPFDNKDNNPLAESPNIDLPPEASFENNEKNADSNAQPKNMPVIKNDKISKKPVTSADNLPVMDTETVPETVPATDDMMNNLEKDSVQTSDTTNKNTDKAGDATDKNTDIPSEKPSEKPSDISILDSTLGDKKDSVVDAELNKKADELSEKSLFDELLPAEQGESAVKDNNIIDDKNTEFDDLGNPIIPDKNDINNTTSPPIINDNPISLPIPPQDNSVNQDKLGINNKDSHIPPLAPTQNIPDDVLKQMDSADDMMMPEKRLSTDDVIGITPTDDVKDSDILNILDNQGASKSPMNKNNPTESMSSHQTTDMINNSMNNQKNNENMSKNISDAQFANIEANSANCEFEHIIDAKTMSETFRLMVMSPNITTPLKIETVKKLDLDKYITMKTDEIDGYPDSFSAMNVFCNGMSIKKTLVESF